MKTIIICDKEYPIECNALTPIHYKSIFKSGMIKDAQYIQNYLIKQTVVANQVNEENISDKEKISKVSEYMIDDVDDFIVKVTQIAWICIFSANEKIEEYKKWLKSFTIKVDDEWIAEVAEFAVDCFC